MKEVQQAVWSVDPNLPLADVHTLGYYYTKSMARTSFTLVMIAVAGGMALLLGIVGIYGVISYSVSQRTREIGIRMALGAERPSITAMFVRDGLWLAGIGIACGLAAAFADHAPDVVAAVQRQPGGSGHLRGDHGGCFGHRFSGLLSAFAPRRHGGPGERAARGITRVCTLLEYSH